MIYLSLFAIILLVNLVPAFAPPTWTVLVFFVLRYELNSILVILIGVTAATLGRLALSYYIKWISLKILHERKIEDLQFLGEKFGKTHAANFTFTFLYSLTPLSTTALFMAAGIAHASMRYVLAGFFLGRLISYTTLVASANLLVANLDHLSSNTFSLESQITALSSIIVVLLFIFIDWRTLLEKRKLRLQFKVWKWNK